MGSVDPLHVVVEQELWIVHLPEGPILSIPWVKLGGRGCPALAPYPVTVLTPGTSIVITVIGRDEAEDIAQAVRTGTIAHTTIRRDGPSLLARLTASVRRSWGCHGATA